MKIIDFERKGNLVRYTLGDEDCTDYWGDDWNDAPYACNAEEDGYDIGDYLSRLELKKIGVDFDAWEKEVFGQSDNGKKL